MASASVPRPKSSLAKDFVFSDGTWVPKLIYGTAWKGDRTADLVYTAIRMGFRGIDTAAQPKHYREDLVAEGVKRAIAEGIVTREELFIQTKFTPSEAQDPSSLPYPADASLSAQMDASIGNSLRLFDMGDVDGRNEKGYLDSLLLHSLLPSEDDNATAFAEMDAYQPYVVRDLGVCNTSTPLRGKFKVDGAFIQNRFVAQTGYDAALRAAHKGIYQAFWVLTANKGLLRSSPVQGVARGAAVSNEVALYALVLGLGNTVVLDGTTSEAHMREDLEGVETVGLWAEGDGRDEWEALLRGFKELVGDAKQQKGSSTAAGGGGGDGGFFGLVSLDEDS